MSIPIIGATAASVRTVDASIASARFELAGIRYVDRVLATLLTLEHFRMRRRSGARAAALAPICTSMKRTLAQTGESDLDAVVRPEYERLALTCRSLATQSEAASAAGISRVVDAAVVLLTAVSDRSGITYDPAIAGLNLGDAVTARFPVALDLALRAAYVVRTPDVGAASLLSRFAAARSLAQAEALLAAGEADVDDALQVDPRLGQPLRRQVERERTAFHELSRRITGMYVEAGLRPGEHPRRTDLEAPRDRLSAAIFAITDTLDRDFALTVQSRISALSATRSRTFITGAAALVLDAAVMLVLAQLTLRRYRNVLERAAAAQTALESQLAHTRSEQALLVAQAQFRAVFDRAPQTMLLIDGNGDVIEANDAAQATLGAAGDRTTPALIARHRTIVDELFAGTRDTYEADLHVANADGQPSRWITLTISLVHDHARRPLFAIAIVHDISERKALEDQLLFDATHDPLTKLPNRRLFIELLQTSIDRWERDARPFCVLFIDFNDFKTINDSLGHSAGDRFLIGAGERLRAAVRSADVVARLGGDEFGILLYAQTTEIGDDFIDPAIARVQAAAAAEIEIDGFPVATSASIGVAPFAAHYLRADEMLRDADMAMYAAKRERTRTHVVFDDKMHTGVVQRMQVVGDLTRALSRGEFELLYQPIVALSDANIVGCEALLRWRRSGATGLVGPTDFIALAEESGAIVDIGRWVIATACEQLYQWQRDGTIAREADFTMHVNLSVPEVHRRDISAELLHVLNETGVGAEHVMLEITENIVLENTPRMREALHDLQLLGVSLCIDDFGTGYSSLRYLHELPLRGFKIDRSFVSGGQTGLANAPIVEMLISLARSLGLEVIAEGIETEQQWHALRELGCALGQGYLFARPLSARSFTQLCERSTGRVSFGRATV